jgi:uncharacterized protein YecT (DUF1311 family)
MPVAQQPQPLQEPAQMTWAPSFDCSKVSNGAERLICSNKELAHADVKLSQVYNVAFNASSDKETLRREQDAWRKNERDACADAACMLKAYQQRITQVSLPRQTVLSPVDVVRVYYDALGRRDVQEATRHWKKPPEGLATRVLSFEHVRLHELQIVEDGSPVVKIDGCQDRCNRQSNQPDSRTLDWLYRC